MKHIQRFLTALKSSRILGSSTLRKLFLAQNIIVVWRYSKAGAFEFVLLFKKKK